MATRHSKAKARRSRSSRALGIKVDEVDLQDRIETERRRLQRADSVLSCIAVALAHKDWMVREIDYADAIDVALELVFEAINRLDMVALRRSRPAEE